MATKDTSPAEIVKTAFVVALDEEFGLTEEAFVEENEAAPEPATDGNESADDGMVTITRTIKVDPNLYQSPTMAAEPSLHQPDIKNAAAMPKSTMDALVDALLGVEPPSCPGECGGAEVPTMDAIPTAKSVTGGGKKCDTPFSECTAKNPMFCPYHGPRIIERDIKDNIRQALHYSMGNSANIPYKVAVTKAKGAGDNVFTITVKCPKEAQAQVERSLDEYMRFPGIKEVGGHGRDENDEAVKEFAMDFLRVDRPPNTHEQWAKNKFGKGKASLGGVPDEVPWHKSEKFKPPKPTGAAAQPATPPQAEAEQPPAPPAPPTPPPKAAEPPPPEPKAEEPAPEPTPPAPPPPAPEPPKEATPPAPPPPAPPAPKEETPVGGEVKLPGEPSQEEAPAPTHPPAPAKEAESAAPAEKPKSPKRKELDKVYMEWAAEEPEKWVDNLSDEELDHYTDMVRRSSENADKGIEDQELYDELDAFETSHRDEQEAKDALEADPKLAALDINGLKMRRANVGVMGTLRSDEDYMEAKLLDKIIAYRQKQEAANNQPGEEAPRAEEKKPEPKPKAEAKPAPEPPAAPKKEETETPKEGKIVESPVTREDAIRAMKVVGMEAGQPWQELEKIRKRLGPIEKLNGPRKAKAEALDKLIKYKKMAFGDSQYKPSDDDTYVPERGESAAEA